MDREAPHLIRQSWLGSLLVIAQEGYLPLRSFAQLRPVCRLFAEPEWCRSQAFAAARFAWMGQRQQLPPLSLTSFSLSL